MGVLDKAGDRRKRELARWDVRLPVPAWQERGFMGLGFSRWKMSTAGAEAGPWATRSSLSSESY